MSQYTSSFIAARGTQKENSATKPVVISRSSCNSKAWQSERGYMLTALQSAVLATKYVGGPNVSLAVNARALSLGIKQTAQVADVVSVINRKARSCYS